MGLDNVPLNKNSATIASRKKNIINISYNKHLV